MAASTAPPYPTPESNVMSTHIECLDCGIEWGWSRDVPSAYERLDRMVDDHNLEFHGYRKVRSDA